MKVILPKPLSNNPKIGLICPAGNIKDKKVIDKAVNYLKKKGCSVKLGKYLLGSNSKFDYLSGTDSQRVSDLESMFRDKTIEGIFCLRGGYGTTRILEDINYDLIRKNPKIFVGYSDITTLLMAIYKKAGLVTFHGPMFGTSFISDNLQAKDKTSEKLFWQLLRNKDYKFSYSNKFAHVINPGKTKGVLLGGNLTLLCSMPKKSFKGAILFIEDCGEAPYKIDRMLTSLGDVFNEVSGVVVGTFDDCGFKNDKEVVELLKDRIGKYKKPVICNFPIGHGKKNYILPVGLKAILNAKELTLKSI